MGSEMCIRDSANFTPQAWAKRANCAPSMPRAHSGGGAAVGVDRRVAEAADSRVCRSKQKSGTGSRRCRSCERAPAHARAMRSTSAVRASPMRAFAGSVKCTRATAATAMQTWASRFERRLSACTSTSHRRRGPRAVAELERGRRCARVRSCGLAIRAEARESRCASTVSCTSSQERRMKLGHIVPHK